MKRRAERPDAAFYGKRDEGSVTKEEYLKTAEDLIYLSACAVNRVLPDADRVKGMDLALLYQAAEFHLLTAVTAMALESAGVRDPSFTQAKSKAIRKTVLMDAEMKELFRRLDAAGIWHMPLKGGALKDLYPALGMRQMADLDILIDASRADDVKDIMESMGFTAEHFRVGVHDVYHKEPVCNFELHRALFRENHGSGLVTYYRDVGNRLIKGAGYERRFTPEDFYLYMVAHAYKHYIVGGTGLRSLLDTYVYLQAKELNKAYVAAEAEKLGIAAFEAANRSLALRLFGGEELTAADKEMLDYILSSGAHGTVIHSVRNTMKTKNWSKAQYALHRFFVPVSRKNPDYSAYAGMYPFFYRHKLLLPFLPFYRAYRALINGRLKAEAKAIRDA